jgi:hypothetical protein
MATENMARTGETDETDRLISSEKVDGATVYNRNGENIGSIDPSDDRLRSPDRWIPVMR